VLFRSTVRGHTKGAFAKTGKAIDNGWIHTLTVENGKITAFKEVVQSPVVLL
jgi:ketosteroid isomerase-like protein